jgi:hypothetical protein
MPRRVFAQLEDVYVERDIAIGHIQHKIDKPGLRFIEGESKPLKALDHCRIGIFTLRRNVGPLVVTAINSLAQFEGLRDLPCIVRCRSDDATSEMGGASGGLRDLAHDCGDLGNVYIRS